MLQRYGKALWDEALISPDDERAVSAYAFLLVVARRFFVIGGGDVPLYMHGVAGLGSLPIVPCRG